MLERGRKAYLRSEWAPAAEEMQRFLALSPPEDEAMEATYALGHSLFQLHKIEPAMPMLERYVAGDKKLKNRDFAMLMLVQVYDQVGQKDKATELARDAINQYPSGEFVNGFRMRLKRVEAAGAAAATPTPAPTANTPAPQPVKAAAPAAAPVPAAHP